MLLLLPCWFYYLSNMRYAIKDIVIGDKVSFHRMRTDALRESHENCKVVGKLDNHLLVVKIAADKPNVIIDIKDVIEVKHNKEPL